MNVWSGRAGDGESEVQRVLQGGFPWLRFPPALEPEFIAEYRDDRRMLIRISLCIALATVLGLAILDDWLFGAESHGVADIVRYGIHLPLLVIGLALTARGAFRWYWPYVHTFAPLYGLAIVVLAARAEGPITMFLAARLVLAAFFFYFMLGLSFRAALRTNLLILAGFAIASYFGHLPAKEAAYLFFLLTCANLYAGAGCYALERANRIAFLERRLLREVATHDGLTGLYNRAAFETAIHRIWKRAAEEREQVACIMIDIDHFKAYNDRYGHQEGDVCLRAVALAVREASGKRARDCVARYGGEEMIAVLPGLDRAAAQRVAQEIVERVDALGIAHDRSLTAPQVSVSVGVTSVLARPGSSHDQAIRIADRALYIAKEQGRARCMALDEDDLNASTMELRVRELRAG